MLNNWVKNNNDQFIDVNNFNNIVLLSFILPNNVFYLVKGKIF